MDRHNKQSSQRLQERPLSHAAAATAPPPATSASAAPPPTSALPHFTHPPTTQPPVHIPFHDPFKNRDPFMPSARNRRGSYGTGLGAGSGAPPAFGERAWSAQPPAPLAPQKLQAQQTQQTSQTPSHGATLHQPPPPPSAPSAPITTTATSNSPVPASAHSQMSYPYDSVRRSSISGAGSPPRYAAGPLDPMPLPPPPSFASRTMPPPSPTSGPPTNSFPMPAPRPPAPAASPFAGVRDLASFASRSAGPSMSISSLIGGDSTSRHGNHSPRTNATAPSPTIRPIHPPSPQRARSASIRTDQGHMYNPRHSDPRASTLPQSAHPPPEQHQSHPHPPPPFSQSNTAGFRPYRSSPSAIHAEDSMRHLVHPPPRPSSQPVHQPPPEHDPRHRQDVYDRLQYHPSIRSFNEQSGRIAATSQPSTLPHPSDRSDVLHDGAVNGHSGPPAHRMSPHPSQSARSTPVPNGQAAGRDPYNPSYREDHHPGLFRPSYPPQYSNHHPSSHPPNGHREDLDYRGSRNETVFGRPVHRQTPPPSDLSRYESGPRPPPTHYTQYSHHPFDTHANEQHARRDGDTLHHRSLLDVSAEMARKNGRSSPLPQAVQGAQPRHTGPTADPGIKNEFGRMFPGLGLGVGSSGTPVAGMSANGTATPSRMSPATQVDPHDMAGTDIDIPPTASRSNKRGRKGREEVTKDDRDGTEAGNTPTLAQQNKRTKTTHPAHHHHHHPHHHHHHHHNVLEDQVAAGPSPFNTLRFPMNPGAAQPVAAAASASAIAGAPHHHHHHHAVHVHGPHHHHHNPNPKPMVPSRQPEISVSNQAVLASVAHHDRKHLGSELYKTRLSLPPRDSTALDARLHFKSLMTPLPLFEGKENCTFTIRVPRGYLRSIATPEDEQAAIAGGLEEICKTRAVWGTDIYTDDSDVVAAAIHSGWICGDFGEYNRDISDLFSEENGDNSTAPLGKIIDKKPKTPVRPTPDADLHVTILILPPLTKYTATTRHHLRSREWGSHHDGMSYTIHSIQFIQEGKTSRFTERTAATTHQRIADDLERRNEAAASLMGLLQGGNRVSVC